MLTIQQLKENYSKEQVLLVLLTRIYFATGRETDAADFIAANQINWIRLYRITQAHGLRSFIYYVIKQHVISVDPAFENRLKKSYAITRHQNLRMGITTAKLISDFKAKDIVIIPYKGAVFAHSYYPDIALRESADVDFLVAAEAVNEIENYFIEKDYTPKTTVPKRYHNYYKRFFKDIVYRTPDGENAFSIEMHWKLMEAFSGDYPGHEYFLPHLQPYSLGGLAASKLTPTYDLLAVVSNHFVKDMAIKFKYLVDIASLINKEDASIDKKVVFETASRYGFTKKLETGLALTTDLLGISMTGRPVSKITSGRFLNVPLAFPVHLPRLYINEPEFIKCSLQLQDNNRRRFKFISNSVLYMFLPTYADINQLKLPAYTLPFLIIIRPLRLLYLSVRSKSKVKASL
ncbi:MAG: hypothetical protein JWR67_3335 [Mucilaginibacter sp.]|nr:hypothetical protein [Mucilaginibacter sp.]